jgi:hypothetical protein
VSKYSVYIQTSGSHSTHAVKGDLRAARANARDSVRGANYVITSEVYLTADPSATAIAKFTNRDDDGNVGRVREVAVDRKRSAVRNSASGLRLWYIGSGYRVSDADAGRLVKALRIPLPRAGYEVQVALPDGGQAWLSRTPLRTSAYGFKAPKRGWVWYVHASRDLSRYVQSAPKRRSRKSK